MVNESFIDNCIRYIFSDRIMTGNDSFIYTDRDIHVVTEVKSILNSRHEADNNLIISSKETLLLNVIPKIINREAHSPNMIKSFISSDSLESIKDLIFTKLTVDNVLEIRSIINKKKKIFNLFKDKKMLSNILDKIDNGELENNEISIFEEYNKVITSLYLDTVINSINQDSMETNCDTFICTNINDMKSKLESIYKDNKDRIFFKLDKRFDNFSKLFKRRALESKRVYIFAAKSGHGKSTFLINLLQSFIKNINSYVVDYNAKVIENILYVPIYITLENEIDESLERLTYCYGADIDRPEIDKLLKRVNDDAASNTELSTINYLLKKMHDSVPSINMNGVTHAVAPYILKYLKPKSTITDVITEIENNLVKLREIFGDKVVVKPGPIIIDYLDNLSSINNSYDLFRLSLGDIVMEMKSLSILYKVPVLTATQINNYRLDLKDYDMDNLTESKKKAENADVVVFIGNSKSNESTDVPIMNTDIINSNLIAVKNRNGKKGVVPIKVYTPLFYFMESNVYNHISPTYTPKYQKPNNSYSNDGNYQYPRNGNNAHQPTINIPPINNTNLNQTGNNNIIDNIPEMDEFDAITKFFV